MKDEQFLREVYEGSYRRLVTGMFAVCGDMGTAEDIVQEAFVRAIASLKDFRRVDNPEAWLRRVAINIHHSRWRRMRKLAGLYAETVQLSADPVPADEAETDHVVLVEALRQLPAAQREAIALHHFMDLSVAEIAGSLGVPDGTVKARLARGRASLAESLRESREVRHG
jgi:RNA polymerase sigma-70 factor (sigma-E family)